MVKVAARSSRASGEVEAGVQAVKNLEDLVLEWVESIKIEGLVGGHYDSGASNSG